MEVHPKAHLSKRKHREDRKKTLFRSPTLVRKLTSKRKDMRRVKARADKQIWTGLTTVPEAFPEAFPEKSFIKHFDHMDLEDLEDVVKMHEQWLERMKSIPTHEDMDLASENSIDSSTWLVVEAPPILNNNYLNVLWNMFPYFEKLNIFSIFRSCN